MHIDHLHGPNITLAMRICILVLYFGVITLDNQVMDPHSFFFFFFFADQVLSNFSISNV